MTQTFLLLYAITNDKTKIGSHGPRLPAASRASPQKHVPITLVGIPYTRPSLLVDLLQHPLYDVQDQD